MKTNQRLNQMTRADLIDYIRELEGEIQGYEDAEEAMMLDKVDVAFDAEWHPEFWDLDEE